MGLLLPRSNNGYAKFTANGTFTVPEGCNRVWVRLISGGGGGGSASTGGGGGYSYAGPYGVVPSQQITITVGAGGTAGNPGGTSSFGSFVSVTGGTAGNGSTHGLGGGQGSPSGTSLGGSVYAKGHPGNDRNGACAGSDFPELGVPANIGNAGLANAAGQPGLVEIFW